MGPLSKILAVNALSFYRSKVILDLSKNCFRQVQDKFSSKTSFLDLVYIEKLFWTCAVLDLQKALMFCFIFAGDIFHYFLGQDIKHCFDYERTLAKLSKTSSQTCVSCSSIFKVFIFLENFQIFIREFIVYFKITEIFYHIFLASSKYINFNVP